MRNSLDTDTCFQQNSLPHLQSVVIVLLKIVLSNVTAFTAQATFSGQANGQNGIPNSFLLQDNHDTGSIPRIPKHNLNLAKQLNGHGNGSRAEAEYIPGRDVEETNAVRLREITSKAIAGILLVLVRWFKLSRKITVWIFFWRCNLTISRCSEIRVLNPASTRLKLSPTCSQILCPSGL